MSVKQRTWMDTRTGEPQTRWQIELRWRYTDGRKPVFVRKVAQRQTKSGAEREERQILKSLMDGTYGRKAVKEVPTLRAYAKDFLSGHVAKNNKPSTAKSREGDLRRYILPALGDLHLDEIGRADIKRFRDNLSTQTKTTKQKPETIKAKTVNNALNTLGKLLRCAKDDEVIDSVPKVEPLPETKSAAKYLRWDELGQLLDAASYNQEWHDMVFFCAHTGLRYGELCELRWSDIDFDTNRMTVSRSFWRGEITDRKNHEVVTVPLSPDVLALVERRRAAFKKNQNLRRLLSNALVFAKPDGGRHIHRRADVALKRCCDKAKMPRIGWHRLRHTFAAGLANAGRPLLEIKELCGHKDIKSTLVYAHLTNDTKMAAVTALDGYYREGAVQAGCKDGH